MLPFLTFLTASILSLQVVKAPPTEVSDPAGPWLALKGSHFVLEITLEFPPPGASEKPALAPAPDVPLNPAVITASMKTARVSCWIKPAAETVSIMLPPYLQVFAASSTCWPEAQRQGNLRAILLFREHKDRSLEQITDGETGRGHNTSLNPSYPAYVEALRTALRWRADEKAPSESRWSAQREALRSSNPYLRRIAMAFLAAHHAEVAIDEEIRAQTTDVQEWKARLKEQTTAPLCADR